jgi:hypothetical protein
LAIEPGRPWRVWIGLFLCGLWPPILSVKWWGFATYSKPLENIKPSKQIVQNE